MTTTAATPTPWPTRDQVVTALGTMQDREDLHPNWRSVLGRLRQDAERHTALRAAGELPERERQTLEQRAFNRLQAGLRALVEQSIGHLAGAWALRRWRGLLYRVRDVFRAAGALVCLGRWLHRVPT
jgi:hypothetical protein